MLLLYTAISVLLGKYQKISKYFDDDGLGATRGGLFEHISLISAFLHVFFDLFKVSEKLFFLLLRQ